LAAKTRVITALTRQLEKADEEVAAAKEVGKHHNATIAELRGLKETHVSDLSKMQRAVASLQAENRDLKNELNAFDPAFFDEIEDLKHSHALLSTACSEYEVLLRRYTAELGIAFKKLR